MGAPPLDTSATHAGDSRSTLRELSRWVVSLAALVLTAVFIIGGTITITGQDKAWIVDIVRAHFAATVGLPGAALVALCLVLFLEHTSGNIEFEGLGFKFKGASGPILLWMICFLAITVAIKLLW